MIRKISDNTGIGIFRADLMIQGDRYKTEIHVVPDIRWRGKGINAMLLEKGLTR